MRRGRQRIVGFDLDHRPHGHAHCNQRLFEWMELRAQNPLDAFAGLVLGPEIVAERFNDVIGRDSDVRRAVFEHLCHGMEHARHRAEWRIGFLEAPDAVEVTKQFVGAVNEVNDHKELLRVVSYTERDCRSQ